MFEQSKEKYLSNTSSTIYYSKFIF